MIGASVTFNISVSIELTNGSVFSPNGLVTPLLPSFGRTWVDAVVGVLELLLAFEIFVGSV
eukprot:CAMPEP_0171304196 /NCGR_PEP_ID=MMETSP0816-20121228/13895_1 /TAXON_ID=420281 /ORGANISM="Proboscia inermis, Strain CCAP1064/1" /LENGTH=60 /DNA_ID=CAMNT_0011784101 /DNA_START=285 /DNA_END=464 /DNA_ORIENTATION=-